MLYGNNIFKNSYGDIHLIHLEYLENAVIRNNIFDKESVWSLSEGFLYGNQESIEKNTELYKEKLLHFQKCYATMYITLYRNGRTL